MKQSFIRNLSRSRARGFTAIELMVVLIVAVSAMSMGGGAVRNYLDGLANQTAADHAKQVLTATQKYVKDNYAAVQAVSTATTPATITVAMLQSVNYLPASLGGNNTFGQSYLIKVLQPTAGQLQTLIVTSGGETINELGIRRIAQMIGAQGGYVSATAATTATGSYGNWTLPLASAPGSYFGVSPGSGHIAMAMFFSDSGTVSDFVYRSLVPGHPELNQMTAPFAAARVTPTDTVVADTTCTDMLGTIARDTTGNLFVCR